MVREERRDEQKMKRGFREGEKMKTGPFSDLRSKFSGIRADLKLNVISGGCGYRCDGTWHFRISAVTCHPASLPRLSSVWLHTRAHTQGGGVVGVRCELWRTGRVGPGARHRAG